MGWLIDPDEQTVFVYRPKQEPEVLDEPEAVILAASFAGEWDGRSPNCLPGYASNPEARSIA